MLTCCEEQEENAAARRRTLRDGAQRNERRFMRKHHLAEQIRSSLRHAACDCDECAVADANDSAKPGETGDASNPKNDQQSDDSDDEMEEALLRKMRAARLAQLRDDAADQRRATRYTRVDAPALLAMLEAASTPPVLCHLALADSPTSAVVDRRLEVLAPSHGEALRFVALTVDKGVPDWLAFVRALPTVILFEGGLVSADATALLRASREPERVAAALDGWVAREASRVASERHAGGGGDSSDADEAEEGYCGRAGCRSYPHEHVAWGKRPSV